jgi:hypothetical protein
MRGSRVAKLERAVASERGQMQADQGEVARLERAIAGASAEQENVVAREVAGELTADKAREHFEQLAAAIDSGQREKERLTRGFSLREARVADLESKLERARFESAVADLEVACADRANVSGHLGKNLRVAAATARKLDVARTRVEEAWAAAKELCPEDVELEWPANADEPSWGSLDGLTECIATGSLQPVADGNAHSANLDERRRRDEAEQIRLALNQGLWGIQRLPEHLREEAQRRFDELARSAHARRNRDRVAVGMPPLDDPFED